MNLVDRTSLADGYDLAIVGSGFGSLFFLKGLHDSGALKGRKVIVLEKGGHLDHPSQVEKDTNALLPDGRAAETTDHIDIPEGHKTWRFTVGLGGGTLCWWGQTPRLHPNDFQTQSLYGIGVDWPFSYADLEPYYCDAEDIIGVAGDSDRTGPFWRSRPYPMPAFVPSDADAAMRALTPDQLAIPAGRTSVSAGSRSVCCAFGNCQRCPNDAKFTALNGFEEILGSADIDILLQADVKAFDVQAGQVTGVVFRNGGSLGTVACDHVVLGANAVFNPAILSRSGLSHPELGRGICEQVGRHLEVRLSNLSGINGGTSATGMFIGDLDGPHRKERGASVVFFDNRWKFQGLRTEHGKYLNTLLLVLNSEDLRSHDNWVETSENWDEKPIVHHARHSDYSARGMDYALASLEQLLEPLGVDGFSPSQERQTESHLQCTTPAGSDLATSIVDGDLIHHSARNLHVVGTSAFPTCPVANPSLTAAAMSLRAAARFVGKGAI